MAIQKPIRDFGLRSASFGHNHSLCTRPSIRDPAAQPLPTPVVIEMTGPYQGAAGTTGDKSVFIAGVRFDALSEKEVVARILQDLDVGCGGTVTTVNVDHLLQILRGSELSSLVKNSDLTVADGAPLLWAARMLCTPLPSRVAGSSLLWSLTAGAAEMGRSIFLLGGPPGIAEAASRALRAACPSLRHISCYCPPPRFEHDEAGMAAVIDAVRGGAPDIVFTALGAPKQEWLNERLKSELPGAWFIGVGGAFEMAAGRVKRAPEWAQRMGLEWTFRLVQEPKRLARRYLIDDLPFVVTLLGRAALKRLAGGARRRHRRSLDAEER